jgi:hypothetical protein
LLPASASHLVEDEDKDEEEEDEEVLLKWRCLKNKLRQNNKDLQGEDKRRNYHLKLYNSALCTKKQEENLKVGCLERKSFEGSFVSLQKSLECL